MIEALTLSPAAPAQAAAPVQAPAAGTDLFAQIMAAVAAGLAAGSVSPEACAEMQPDGGEAAAESPAGEGAGVQEEDQAGTGDLMMAAEASVLSFMKPLEPAPAAQTVPAAAGAASGENTCAGESAGSNGIPGKARCLEMNTAAWLLDSLAAVPAAAAKLPAAATGKTAVAKEAVTGAAAAALAEAKALPAGEMTAVPAENSEAAAPAAAEGPAAAFVPAAAAEPGAGLKTAVMPAQKNSASREMNSGAQQNGGGNGAGRAGDGALPAREEHKAGASAERGLPAEAVKEPAEVKKAFTAAKNEAGQDLVPAVPFEKTALKEAAGEGAVKSLPAETVRRMAEAACDLEAKGRGSVNFEINDGELGKMRVQMSLDGGDVKIRLKMESAEAGSFIAQKTSDLVDALAQRGVNGEVSVFSGDAGGHEGQGRGQARHTPRFEPAEAATAAQEEAPAEEKGRLSVYA